MPEEIKTCYYYYSLQGAAGGIEDDILEHPHRILLNANDKTFAVNIVGDDQTINFVRIDIPGCHGDTISQDDLEVIHALKERAESVLALVYEHSASYLPWAMWIFRSENTTGPLGVKMRAETNIDEEYAVPYDAIVNVLNIGEEPFQIRSRLLADSLNPQSPLRYQYLAAYQVIEDEFMVAAGLDTNGMAAFLVANGSSLTVGQLIGLRDKCAHIKYKRHAGYNALEWDAASEVQSVLPEVQRLARVLTASASKGLMAFDS